MGLVQDRYGIRQDRSQNFQEKISANERIPLKKKGMYLKNIHSLQMSELDPVNQHGRLVPLPGREPFVARIPEIFSGVRRVVGPWLPDSVVDAIGEETIGASDGDIEDHVE
ncbi:unnamed protein product, partial [Lymnaea stagnalis]